MAPQFIGCLNPFSLLLLNTLYWILSTVCPLPLHTSEGEKPKVEGPSDSLCDEGLFQVWHCLCCPDGGQHTGRQMTWKRQAPLDASSLRAWFTFMMAEPYNVIISLNAPLKTNALGIKSQPES